MLAKGDGPFAEVGAAVATLCSSRVGFSLNTSRSPDLLSLFKAPVSIVTWRSADGFTHSGSERVNM